MVRETMVEYPIGELMSGPRYIGHAAKVILDTYDREAFLVAHLNAKHKLISMEVVAVGTINATLVHPREVFKGAVLANAVSVCLVHNHPSGDPTPSADDIALTKQLLEAGEILGIRVLDHLVLGYDRSVSLRENTSLWREQSFHR
jgi:DNA repair protein RadC